MNRKIEYFASIASIVGCLLTIYQIIITPNCINKFWGSYFCYTSDSIRIMISIFLMMTFIIIFTITRIHLNHSKHYLDAYETIQDIHYKILKDYDEYRTLKREEAISKLSDVCSSISDMFSTLRRTKKISVCIKYTNQENEALYVKTLCRDNDSRRQRENLYNDDKLDLINQNTDFECIFDKLMEKKDWRQVYFFSNFLPWKYQYKNSHLDSKRLPGLKHFYLRSKKWSLLYRSTIVVPIVSDDELINYGYLCVDSPKNKGFNSNFDIKIVQDLALLLSPTIRLVSKKHLIKAQEKKQETPRKLQEKKHIK